MLCFYLSLIEDEEEKSKFERLYHRYKQMMYYAAKRILGDGFEAEDAVQQAFIKVTENLEKIGEIDCPKTHGFLVTIVRSCAVDLYRKRRDAAPLDEMADLVGTGDDFARLEEEKPLAAAILKLPADLAAVINLRFVRGYSVSETARILKISEDNAYKRIQRARKQLEKLMEEEKEAERLENYG